MSTKLSGILYSISGSLTGKFSNVPGFSSSTRFSDYSSGDLVSAIISGSDTIYDGTILNTYTIIFSGAGTKFLNTIGSNVGNFIWSTDKLNEFQSITNNAKSAIYLTNAMFSSSPQVATIRSIFNDHSNAPITISKNVNLVTAVVAAVANFTVPTTYILVNDTLLFTNTSYGTERIATPRYTWDFSDGTSQISTDTKINVTHSYSSSGRKNATLTFYGASATVTYSNQIWAIAKPIANFTASPQSNNYRPATYNFINNSTYDSDPAYTITSAWSFGSGSKTSTLYTPPSLTYYNSGSYNITYTITGNPTGSATVTKNIRIFEIAPDTTISSDRTKIPSGGVVTFWATLNNYDVSNIKSYNWYSGDGQQNNTLNPTASFTYNSYGTYTAYLSASGFDFDKRSNNTINIKVIPTPIVSLSFSPSPSTVDLPINGNSYGVTYTAYMINASDPDSWDFNDGNINTNYPSSTIPTLGTSYYNVRGTKNLLLKANSVAGTGSYSSTITFKYPRPTSSFTISPDPDLTYHQGQTFIFSNNTTAHYLDVTSSSWTFGDGGTSNTFNASHKYNIIGTYSVSLTTTGLDYSHTYAYPISIDAMPSPTIMMTQGVVGNWPTLYTDDQITFTITTASYYSSALNSDSLTFIRLYYGDNTSQTFQNPIIPPYPTIPNKTYSIAGNYTAKITITGSYSNSGEYSIPLTILQYNPPVVSYTVSPLNAYIGDDIILTNNSSGTISTSPPYYRWQLDYYKSQYTYSANINTFTQGEQYVVSYGFAGTHYINQYIYGRRGTIITGTGSTVNIFNLPQASFTVTPTTGRRPLTVSFTNSSQMNNTDPIFTTTSVWNFGDGVTENNTYNTTHIYTARNIFNAAYTITPRVNGTPFGPTFSNNNNIVVKDQIPSVTITTPSADTIYITPGSTVTYNYTLNNSTYSYVANQLWTFGDGKTSTSKNASNTFSSVGVFTTTLTVDGNDDTNVAATNTKTIKCFEQPSISLTNNTGSTLTIPAGNTYVFSTFTANILNNPKTNTYINIWTFKDNGEVYSVQTSSISNQQDVIFNSAYSQNKTYKAELTASTDYGTTQYASQNINVIFSSPYVNTFHTNISKYNGYLYIWKGNTVTFTIGQLIKCTNDNVTYTYNFGNGDTNVTVSANNITGSITYSKVYTNGNYGTDINPTLTVAGLNGSTITSLDEMCAIRYFDIPSVTFTADSTNLQIPISGTTISTTLHGYVNNINSTRINSYKIQSGSEGFFTITDPSNITALYKDPGNYTATLNTYYNTGSLSSTINIYVQYSDPTVSITKTSSNDYEGWNTSFSATTTKSTNDTLTYAWYYKSTSSGTWTYVAGYETSNYASIKFNTPGSYDVKLIVTGGNGHPITSNILTFQISAVSAPNVSIDVIPSNIYVGQSSSIYIDYSYDVNDPGSFDLMCSYGDGLSSSVSPQYYHGTLIRTSSSVTTHTYNNVGTYHITASAIGYHTSNLVYSTIIVSSWPAPTITSADIVSSEGGKLGSRNVYQFYAVSPYIGWSYATGDGPASFDVTYYNSGVVISSTTQISEPSTNPGTLNVSNRFSSTENCSINIKITTRNGGYTTYNMPVTVSKLSVYLSSNPDSVQVPVKSNISITFGATGSRVDNAGTFTYLWKWGDNSADTVISNVVYPNKASATHSYFSDVYTIYTASVRATDDWGTYAENSIPIVIGTPNTASLSYSNVVNAVITGNNQSYTFNPASSMIGTSSNDPAGANQTASTTFTLVGSSALIKVSWDYSTELYYDIVSITAGGTTIVSASGMTSNTWSGSLNVNDTVAISYKKDGSNSGFNDPQGIWHGEKCTVQVSIDNS
jgi:PKD repeat protein